MGFQSLSVGVVYTSGSTVTLVVTNKLTGSSKTQGSVTGSTSYFNYIFVDKPSADYEVLSCLGQVPV